MIGLSIGKVTVRDVCGTVLGTVERISDGKHEYNVGRIRGYAGSYGDAVRLMRGIGRILPRTPKEQQRGQTGTGTKPSKTSRRG